MQINNINYDVTSWMTAIACEQALLFGRVKRISQRAAKPRGEAHFAYPNRRACSQAMAAIEFIPFHGSFPLIDSWPWQAFYFFPILSQRPTVTSQFKYQFVYCYFLFPGFGKYTVDSRFTDDTWNIQESLQWSSSVINQSAVLRYAAKYIATSQYHITCIQCR